MGVAAVLDWMVQDGERLANCRHDHPFAVLGPQPSDQGWTVRMWMPEAQSVTLLVAGEPARWRQIYTQTLGSELNRHAS